MLFFFTVIIVLPLLMINVLKQQTKIMFDDLKVYNNTLNISKMFEKEVFQYHENYYQTHTKKPVYKKKDLKGKIWWYYTKTNEPMEYIQRSNMIENYNYNMINIKNNKKKWFTLIDYWDNSAYSIEPFTSPESKHLDDYTLFPDFIKKRKYNKYIFETIGYREKNFFSIEQYEYDRLCPEDKKIVENYFIDNNPSNQKIYCKNMRPYQLSGILNLIKVNGIDIYKVQYLIRFKKGECYLDRQRNINEKEMDELWTNWYAISEDEYKSLTNLIIDDYLFVDYKIREKMWNYIKKQFNIIQSRIAFENENKELNWNLENTGIKKAFDNNGNFIGE